MWQYIFIVCLLLVTWITVDLILGTKRQRSTLSPYKAGVIRKSHAVLFTHGDSLFDHMLSTIDKAHHHIHIQFFIFRSDHIGQKFLDLFKQKAQQGIDVRLLVDWGGDHISRKEKASLKKAGVQVAITNVPAFPFLFYSINKRNHRKVSIIDGEHGYIGGYNVGDEYLGRDPKKGRWRDYHLYIQGEACQDLQQQFVKDWNTASNDLLSLESLTSKTLKAGPTSLTMVTTDGSHVIESIHGMLDKAEKSIFIGTPYFIPDKSLTAKLIDLAKKGMEINVLLPKYPDHPLVKDAAYPYFPALLQAGVHFHQFYEGFYHAKVIIVDDALICIGTSNFDKRSFYINKEINCFIEDSEWTRDAKGEIEKDLIESSEPITMAHVENRTLWEKTKEKLATLFSYFL
ncbi:cardiolipin synthase [Salipaludibacillus agaradhaerens]|uniref:Cardiolipin synthase n=1 Tax=Salipaludibacillus agaradhaerens TaxID=76935 RepID=A0A9Q4B5B5_SALAG|nr:cardiolipin synthase [Salipaludibacillus agaradhaerens]MCR6098587.1 cardiolipin synthase [Salipaludibacillus agaradhaerens]MCR6115594.1 cardiolipin synthase [Salipaludibacillus agaradhaerens]